MQGTLLHFGQGHGMSVRLDINGSVKDRCISTAHDDRLSLLHARGIRTAYGQRRDVVQRGLHRAEKMFNRLKAGGNMAQKEKIYKISGWEDYLSRAREEKNREFISFSRTAWGFWLVLTVFVIVVPLLRYWVHGTFNFLPVPSFLEPLDVTDVTQSQGG